MRETIINETEKEEKVEKDEKVNFSSEVIFDPSQQCRSDDGATGRRATLSWSTRPHHVLHQGEQDRARYDGDQAHDLCGGDTG